MRKWVRITAVILAAALFSIAAAGHTGMIANASEKKEEQEKPESEMTEEEKAEKAAKEAREKALKEAYELPVQTNKLKGWPEGPGTYGDAGIVMDADSGAILYAKNIDKHEYPASITKVLTALLAFQYGDMFALLPYIYAIKREVTMREVLNVINHIILEDIEKLVIKDMNAIAMGVRQ